MELYPNRKVFVTYRFLRDTAITAFFALVLYVGLFVAFKISYLWLYISAAFLILRAISYYSLSVQYSKEKYIIQENRIIHRSGGIFSDHETELIIRNITNVTMLLPYLEHKLFSTGSIGIQSAGSGGIEVFLQSLDEPQKMYDTISTIMRKNGFSLKKDKLVQEERPNVLGVGLEVFGGAAIGLITFLLIFMSSFAPLIALFRNIADESFIVMVLALLIGAIVICGALFFIILKFLDLKNRRYRLYDDTVTYEEGFLTRNYSFLPVENLADSTVNQNVVERILGLYDVKVSCQGARQEILFKNMENGKMFEENLDNLLSQKKGLALKQKAKEKPAAGQAKKTAAVPKTALSRDKSYTAEFSMDMKRSLIPYLILLGLMIILFPLAILLFPLIFAWVAGFVKTLIDVNVTRFMIKPESIEQRRDFLSSKHVEFTIEKITGIVIKENFIDHWLGTCSIHFWSIGSNEDIQFKNIKKAEGLYESVLAKSGIREEKPMYEKAADYSLLRMLKAAFPLTLLMFAAVIIAGAGTLIFPLLAIVPVLILTIYLIIWLYRKRYYRYTRIRFYKDYVYFRRGFLFKEHYYALYDNIKDVSTVKYPFSDSGSMRFNIAGERLVQQGKNQAVVSNSFIMRYMPQIQDKDDLADVIFHYRPKPGFSMPERKELKVSRPALANSLFVLGAVSVVLFPLIVLLPITVPLLVWHVRVKSYTIEDYRLVSRWGMLYKSQLSIVFSKIDHINSSQGFLNKMFSNGDVIINTAGSSRAELVIKNIPDYKGFYEIMQKNY